MKEPQMIAHQDEALPVQTAHKARYAALATAVVGVALPLLGVTEVSVDELAKDVEGLISAIVAVVAPALVAGVTAYYTRNKPK